MSRHLSVIATTAAAVAVLGLTACTGSDGSTDATSAPPLTSTNTAGTSNSSASPSVTDTVTRTATTTDSASSSSAAPSSRGSACAESQLRASVKADQIAGFPNHVVRVNFLNKSSKTCTLTGYPGAAIEDSANHQVQQAKRVAGGPVGGTVEKSGTVTVRAGSTVFAYLEGTSTREKGAAQAGCDGPKYPRIVVTPPNTDTAVPFSLGWPQCYTFDVHPVRSQ